jgi:hypothetical protein
VGDELVVFSLKSGSLGGVVADGCGVLGRLEVGDTSAQQLLGLRVEQLLR